MSPIERFSKYKPKAEEHAPTTYHVTEAQQKKKTIFSMIWKFILIDIITLLFILGAIIASTLYA